MIPENHGIPSVCNRKWSSAGVRKVISSREKDKPHFCNAALLLSSCTFIKLPKLPLPACGTNLFYSEGGEVLRRHVTDIVEHFDDIGLVTVKTVCFYKIFGVN